MAKTLRVAHAGYDAETETDPSRFSLIADGDNVLIKEHSRDRDTGTGTINHNLGYIPFFLIFGETSAGSGVYGLRGQFTYLDNWKVYSTVNDLVIFQTPASAERTYVIFYDNMEEVT